MLGGGRYPAWFGLFLPANAPRAVVAKQHRETLRALQEPAVRDRLAAVGVDSMVMSPRVFGAHVQKEMAVNAALANAAGIQPP